MKKLLKKVFRALGTSQSARPAAPKASLRIETLEHRDAPAALVVASGTPAPPPPPASKFSGKTINPGTVTQTGGSTTTTPTKQFASSTPTTITLPKSAPTTVTLPSS